MKLLKKIYDLSEKFQKHDFREVDVQINAFFAMAVSAMPLQQNGKLEKHEQWCSNLTLLVHIFKGNIADGGCRPQT